VSTPPETSELRYRESIDKVLTCWQPGTAFLLGAFRGVRYLNSSAGTPRR